jgi:hypothetical protein
MNNDDANDGGSSSGSTSMTTKHVHYIWVQGRPTNIDKESGNVILVEVFHVNCPGCFIHGIPQAIDMYKKYHDSGLRILGLATAFEDFDKNTLENLKLLLATGQVIGEPSKVL